jgi:RNA polymerase sigma-70 factor (ECF subfamily)
VSNDEFIAELFEAHRKRLRAVGYRMLGSASEAEDAVQEAWLRLNRTDPETIDNLGGWLTTVVARICLNMLQARNVRREDPLELHEPDLVVTRAERHDPGEEALLADSVGVALLVVLETLLPAERVAFVLHDMFAVPFEEIAGLLGRSAPAARQLASRARRRVQGSVPPVDPDITRKRRVVDAFFAAARGGDLGALIAVLAPDVVLRSDDGTTSGDSALIRGAAEVARRAMMFAGPARLSQPVLVNGGPGVVVFVDGQVVSLMVFTVSDGRITAIDGVVDPERLGRLDLSELEV